MSELEQIRREVQELRRELLDVKRELASERFRPDVPGYTGGPARRGADCECGGKTRVTDSRPTGAGVMAGRRRRIVCTVCGRRWTIFE